MEVAVLITLVVFGFVAFVLWLVAAHIRAKIRHHAEVQKELIAKFSSPQELADFLNSEAGKLLIRGRRRRRDGSLKPPTPRPRKRANRHRHRLGRSRPLRRRRSSGRDRRDTSGRGDHSSGDRTPVQRPAARLVFLEAVERTSWTRLRSAASMRRRHRRYVRTSRAAPDRPTWRTMSFRTSSCASFSRPRRR